MGVGEAKRPWAASAGVAAVRAVAALLLFLIVLLLILRTVAELREHEVAAPSGTVIIPTATAPVAVQVRGPAGGTPVLLVHGTAAWSGFWREVADHLAGQGWRVVAVDLPPFGWSGHDPEGRYDRVTQAERLSAVVQSLGRPAIVVGHSFGAGPATELALRHSRQLRGLVLVDAALGAPDPTAEAPVARAMRFGPVAELATSAAITNPVALEPLLRSMIARKEQAERWVPVLRQPMRREGTTSAYADWLPNLFATQDGALSRRTANLRAIEVPVALIWGDADTVTPLDQGRRIAQLTRARSLQLLRGVGHIPHIEDPPAFLRSLDRALADVEKGAK